MATTAAVDSKELTLSHGKTRYLEAGTGHPVILLHGAAVSGGADDFRPVIDRLRTRYRCLAPDFIGWPPTDARADVDAFPYMTDEIREFQDALGLKSSHIVGATMGGWIAGLFAYESPNRVDKLVMTGNPGFHGAANNRLAEYQIPSEERVREAIQKVGVNMSEAEQEALIQEKVRRLNEPGHAENYGQMMKTMANPINRSRFNLLRRMPLMTMPTLLLLGKGDPSSEHGEELQRLLPGSQLHIIQDGAHQVHYDNTEEFCKVVADFLG
jgi:pimeloyl-ACP methyl ester carboxylesterase